MRPVTIRNRQALRRAIAELGTAEPVFERLHALVGEPPLRLTRPGLATMLRVVTEQSISLKAAAAIWARLAAELDPASPPAVLAVPPERLRALGLTMGKARAFHGLAAAASVGLFESLARMDDGTARNALVALPGIGPWTAEIYLLVCLARADAWPAGDVALQSAAGRAFGLDPRPTQRELERLAEPWRPWRSVAARLLWAYYRHDATGA